MTPTAAPRRRRWYRACCSAILLWLALSASAVPAGADTIRSDGHWRENPDCPPGWEQPSFADHEWPLVPFPWLHLWPRDWEPDSQARPIWGSDAFAVNCLRRTFELDELPQGDAIAHVWADDDYELFVNGVEVGASRDHAAVMPGERYDITSLLQLGDNVIALRVIDAGGVMATLFTLDLPGVEAADETLWQAARSLYPWLVLFAFVAAVGAWAWAIHRLAAHRLAQTMRRRSEHLAVRAILAAASCQLVLAVVTLYQGEREIPVLDWNLLALLLTALVFGWLVVAADGLATVPRDATPVRREGCWLAAIVVVGLVARVAWLDSIPVGFFQDEATNGNDALALGRLDHWLLWSESVGGRPTLFLYALSCVLNTFGVSYLTLKIVPVAAGTATIVAVWALGRTAFEPRIGLWAAFLVAASRWHVHYSRMAWEVILLPLFACAGIALLAYGLRRRRAAGLAIVASAVVLAVGLYTYAAYRAIPAVAIALVLAVAASSDRWMLWRRAPALIVGTLLAGATAWPLLSFAASHPELYWWRYTEVSLTSYMAYFGTPLPWLDQIGRSALSLNHVGDAIVRHNLPDAPHLDPLTGGLFLLGLAVALWNCRRFGPRLVLVWIAVFLPLASLTRDGPHATRLLGLLPPCALLAALAVQRLADALAPRLGGWRAPVAGGILAALIGAWNAHDYFVRAAQHPDADALFNVTGRRVCEFLRRHDDVRVFFSDDIGFWADGQCFFLARGRYDGPHPIRVDDVVAGGSLGDEGETMVVLGREFFDIHAAELRDRGGVSLPGPAIEERGRQGQLLYRLYHFGGETGRGRARPAALR